VGIKLAVFKNPLSVRVLKKFSGDKLYKKRIFKPGIGLVKISIKKYKRTVKILFIGVLGGSISYAG
jgi:hypothetical protein